MVSPGNNGSNYNNKAVWSGVARQTTVGTNGGPSYYGTYDQDGNVAELINNGSGLFPTVGSDYNNQFVGRDVSLPPPNFNITNGGIDVGFRLYAKNYTDIRISSVCPKFFSLGSGISYSFYINNYENFKVSGLVISGSYFNIENSFWSCSYNNQSSGTISGFGNILVNCDLGSSGSLTINFSGTIETNSLVLSDTITLSGPYSLQQTSDSILSIGNTELDIYAGNYASKFNHLDWGSITPNSFVEVGDSNNPLDSTYRYLYVEPMVNLGGRVNYHYNITKYYITNNEYCLFLNSVDPQGLNPQLIYRSGAIDYNSGNSNGNKYVVITSPYNRGNKAVDNTTVMNMMKYCNWLSNGAKSYATTDSGINAPQNNGSYNIGIASGNATLVSPVPTGRFRLPNLSELYKAYFYSREDSVINNHYFAYATKSSSPPGSLPGQSGSTMDGLYPQNEYSNSANYGGPNGFLTTVGTNGAPSAYGLHDAHGCVHDVIIDHNSLIIPSGIYSVRLGSWKNTNVIHNPVGGYYRVYQPNNSLPIVSITNTGTIFSINDAYGFRVVSSGLFGDVSLDIVSSGFYYQNSPLDAIATIKNNSTFSTSGTIRVLASGENLTSSGNWNPAYYGGATGPNLINNNISHSITLPPASKVILTAVSILPNQFSVSPILISGTLIPANTFNDISSINNTEFLFRSIDPQTHLNIVMSGSEIARKKEIVSYDIMVTNTGTSYVKDIYLYTSFALDNGIDFSWKNINLNNGVVVPISGSTGNVSSIFSLLPNQQCSFKISGVVNNTISEFNAYANILVTGNQTGSGQAMVETSFEPTDLKISYSGIPAYYFNSEYLSYKIIIENSGNTDSYNSRILHDCGVSSENYWKISYDVSSTGIGFGSGNIDTNILLGASGQAIIDVTSFVDASYQNEILLQSSIVADTITDSNINNNSISYLIPHSVRIVSVKSSESSCSNNGFITVQVSGGAPPYRYLIDGNTITSDKKILTVSNLSAGTYTPIVTDSTNVSSIFDGQIQIEESTILSTVEDIYSPTLLDSYGSVSISVAGTNFPYSFIFTDSDGNSIVIPTLETKYLISSEPDNSSALYTFDDLLLPGSYSYLIQDKNNDCQASGSFDIPNISPITAQISTVDDSPINLVSPVLTLDIFDTILIPYRQIREDTNLWKLIKKLNIKDNIAILINDTKYDFRIVRNMLDKHCIDTDNSIELLKLGNSEEDWYFFFYIAPSVDLTNDPTNIDSSLEILDTDTQEKFKLILGLSESNQLDQNDASLIRGSFILTGLGYNEYFNGMSINVSIGNNQNNYDYYIKNIDKSVLNNIYNLGFVTTINFLEQLNVARQYVTIGDTSCSLSKEDYQYKLNIKELLIAINNFNNINNIYILNANDISHNGQLNAFIAGNDTFITKSGTVDNVYSIGYFTFDKDSRELKHFEINNQIIENINVISGLDSRYVLIRIKDIYDNIPRIVSINGVVSTYDSHFVDIQRTIQDYNTYILEQLQYGDILAFVNDSSIATDTTQTDNTGTVLNPNELLDNLQAGSQINTVEQTKDSTDAGSLLVTIPAQINIELFGPNNYHYTTNKNTIFKNLIPGLYVIRGDEDSLRENNLYQNEFRILISKNKLSTITIDFTSYANKLFIKDEK